MCGEIYDMSIVITLSALLRLYLDSDQESFKHPMIVRNHKTY